MALLVFALPATASAAAPATRDEALEAYRAVLDDEKVDAGWTGSVQDCKVGTESQASLDATLHTINTLRSFAGIGPVTFDATMNHKALAAALMMKAAGDLSHTPGPSWPCYSTDGAYGAGHSNLFLGLSGPAAMVGYLDESGDLGHRRWVIDPGAALFGTGSTGTTNALMVFDTGSRKPVPAGTKVAWPAAGFMPWPWIFSDWSIALGGTDDEDAWSTNNAQVHVSLDGQPLDVKNVASLDDGYGTGQTMSWTVDVPSSATSADHDLAVTIDGVTLNGTPQPISYTVSALATGDDNGGGFDEAACNEAMAKLAKAKAKLKRLRQNGASKRRIKRAKKKVRAAKAAVAAAC